MSKGVNNKVNFLKFAFSILIVVRHFLGQYSGIYDGELFELWSSHSSYFGLFGVTFFFIVSGYFMTSAALKAPDTNCGEQAISYVVGKYKKQFRVYFAALLFAFCFYCVTTPAENRTAMYSVLVELLALQCSGLPCELLNAPTWYISAMLIAMLPLYFLNTRYKQTYVNLIAPLGALLILGYSYRMSSGNLADGGIYYRLGRAFWGLMLGSVCYLVSEKLKNNIKRVTATFIEAAMWLLICWYLFAEKRLFNYSSNAVVIVALTIALSFTFSKQSYTHAIFDKAERLCTLLGKWSVYIYFNHWTVLTIVFKYTAHHPNPVAEVLKLLVFTAALSVAELAVFKLLDAAKTIKAKKNGAGA